MAKREEWIKRRAGYQPLRLTLGDVGRPAFDKYGSALGMLATNWSDIVPAPLCHHCSPKSVSYRGAERAGTLVIEAQSNHALTLEYMREQLIERIAAFMGYRAVTDIRIVQSYMSGIISDDPWEGVM